MRNYLLTWLVAAERLDIWVLRASIAILLACIGGLILWHLIAYLAGKLPKKPRTVRHSPEPPSALQPPLLPRGRFPAEVGPTSDDPEGLQEACTALEDALAEKYMQLAESWLRGGQPQKAAAALKRILQICPGRHQAQVAQDCLQKIGQEVADQHS